MKIIIIILFVSLFGLITTAGAETASTDQEPPAKEEVFIAPNGLKMPLGRIFVVRKGSQYCAVKFTEAWTGETKADIFANYESYYQGDGTGDFSNKNTQFSKGQLARRRAIMFGRIILYHTGPGNFTIKCGGIRIFWDRGWVSSIPMLIEMAPTKWADISQVNVFDKRLQWYRYDEQRGRTSIPIDQLWENGEDQR